jgi:hypothetical protein
MSPEVVNHNTKEIDARNKRIDILRRERNEILLPRIATLEARIAELEKLFREQTEQNDALVNALEDIAKAVSSGLSVVVGTAPE